MAATEPDSPAFLLSQLGSHAGLLFTEQVAELGLSAPQVAVLRAIAADPGASQQALAKRLGVLPSRMVAFVDDLAGKDLVRRERHPSDRRTYALQLTDAGQQKITELTKAGRKHSEVLLAALSEAERATLAELLRRVADEQGLIPGVHPGQRYSTGR